MPLSPGFVAAAPDPAAEFARLVTANLQRYLRQNSLPALAPSEEAGLAVRLWSLVGERGLPRRLAPGESGSPGEIPEADCGLMVAHVLAGANPTTRDGLAAPVRQLVKACFNPEFTDCRNSYREVSPDGSCRRQELARTRKRISGAHCVDCPHWIALAPAAHAEFLAGAWQPAHRAEFAAHRDIFLPEDFRALRLLLSKTRPASP